MKPIVTPALAVLLACACASHPPEGEAVPAPAPDAPLAVPAALETAPPPAEAPRAPEREPPAVEPEPAVTLVARWAPLASSKHALTEDSPELAALLTAGPAEPEHDWPASAFAFLLPPAGTEPGASWKLDARPCLPFLRQLHPGATLALHHGFGAKEGAVATLLDATRERLDVLFRVHAEIEAIPGVLYVTPAQFEGRLVWDRARSRVLDFELALPPRDTNVDLNARVGERVLADIGFVPEMSVRLARAAAPRAESDLAEPQLALRRALYGGFTGIDWMPLAQAAHRARTEDRALHVLILFGALDDESC